MGRYRKKPVEIEALQYTGDNKKECETFIEGNFDNTLNYPNIKTLEGVMRVSNGDFIIRGVDGEFYPCKESIFKKTYDLVEDPFGPVTNEELEMYEKSQKNWKIHRQSLKDAFNAEGRLEESAKIQEEFERLHG